MFLYIVYQHSVTAIVIGYQLFLASALNLGFRDKQFVVLISKLKGVCQPKNSVYVNLLDFSGLLLLKLHQNFLLPHKPNRYVYLYVYIYIYIYIYICVCVCVCVCVCPYKCMYEYACVCVCVCVCVSIYMHV